LVDDRAARRVAVQRGLLITGTVGVLDMLPHAGF
jgi:predicted nucleic acid-binding protein